MDALHDPEWRVIGLREELSGQWFASLIPRAQIKPPFTLHQAFGPDPLTAIARAKTADPNTGWPTVAKRAPVASSAARPCLTLADLGLG